VEAQYNDMGFPVEHVKRERRIPLFVRILFYLPVRIFKFLFYNKIAMLFKKELQEVEDLDDLTDVMLPAILVFFLFPILLCLGLLLCSFIISLIIGMF